MKEATVEKIAEEVRAARLAADAKVKEGLAALSKAVERMRAGLERAERALERHANAESLESIDLPRAADFVSDEIASQTKIVLSLLQSATSNAHQADCLYREAKKAEETASRFA